MLADYVYCTNRFHDVSFLTYSIFVMFYKICFLFFWFVGVWWRGGGGEGAIATECEYFRQT